MERKEIVWHSFYHSEVDYYGKPTYKTVLMRFDFPQPGDLIEPRWSKKSVKARPLGIAPSGKFAIYLMQWVPVYMTRADLASDLRPHIPPTDRFMLWFPDRYSWRVEPVKPPLVLPQKEAVLASAAIKEVLQ